MAKGQRAVARQAAGPTASEARAPAREDAMRIDFEVSGGRTVHLFKPLTPASRALSAPRSARLIV